VSVGNLPRTENHRERFCIDNYVGKMLDGQFNGFDSTSEPISSTNSPTKFQGIVEAFVPPEMPFNGLNKVYRKLVGLYNTL
jgi:hypothetical protein